MKEKSDRVKESKPAKKEPLQSEVNIGLIGHVDAGKTSLVEALTGKWTDTHSEELKRGISIRIGYADTVFYKCPKCSTMFSVSEKCPKCGAKGEPVMRASFVDAPGHETLMTTMLSGAAMMHGAVLVVAANEKCPQAQTIEHLNAIRVLGLDKIVVAQNKIDLVDEKRAMESYREIKKFMEENECKNTPIIPVAAHSKANIDVLIEAIVKTIPKPAFDLNKPVKMYCGRSFDVNRPGTKPSDLKGGVLGGTILQGKIKVGDEVEIGPGYGGKKIVTRIESISCAGGKLKEARPGGLIAFETTLDPSLTQNDQMKGQVIGAVGSLPEPVMGCVFKIEFLKRQLAETAKEIKTNELLVLTIGTMTTIATVTESGKEKIKVALRAPAIIEKNQNIAISRKKKMKWRLIAFGRAE